MTAIIYTKNTCPCKKRLFVYFNVATYLMAFTYWLFTGFDFSLIRTILAITSESSGAVVLQFFATDINSSCAGRAN